MTEAADVVRDRRQSGEQLGLGADEAGLQDISERVGSGLVGADSSRFLPQLYITVTMSSLVSE